MAKQGATTQRAYTLRLRGADPQDQSWREALWRTHEAINRGAKAFGDWLLTLRGGLDHTLADATIPQGKGKPDRDPNDERKARRILLALSWLSVESEKGAPAKYIVAHDLDERSGTRSSWKTVEALREILKKRGLGESELSAWVQDCLASLSASIRDDAVWVNRSQAFDDAVESAGCSLTRREVWDDMLKRFFVSSEAYLARTAGDEDEPGEGEREDKARDLVQKAGGWLSSRFGTGKGADFSRMATVYGKIAEWASQAQSGMPGNRAIADLAVALNKFGPKSNDLQGVLGLISGPGHKSATRNLLSQWATRDSLTQQDFESLKQKATDDGKECEQKTGSKGRRPYSDAILRDAEAACGFTYLQDGGAARHWEFVVMLDHAARRVSLAHTWIKRAEAERRRFEEHAKKIEQVPENIKKWLDDFCSERSQSSGALEPYRIRRRAVDGWEEIVKAWSRTGCRTKEDRIAAARALQDDPEIAKFGDIQLFEALAEEDATHIWHKDGDTAKGPDPQPLINYVLASEAEFRKRHFKVPMYRHPDPLSHPVFCDFGNSRWRICFAVHEAAKLATRNRKTRKGADGNDTWLKDRHALRMGLWDGKKLRDVPLRWSCKRLTEDLALREVAGSGSKVDVARADRLGRAAAGTGADSAVQVLNVFQEEHWNGRLQAPRAQLDAIAKHVSKHGWDGAAERMRRSIRWLVSFSARLQPAQPWVHYASKFPDGALPAPLASREGKYVLSYSSNSQRQGHAKLVLSRLPRLRVLSVDLGHRYAAACAVWETLTADEMIAACRDAGHATPAESDMFLHLTTTGAGGKKRTTIYRRIGADQVADMDEKTGEVVPHPAPWARLERQFLIKLQGEDREAREASDSEIWAVHQAELELGRAEPLIDRLVASGWGLTEKQKSRLKRLRDMGWQPSQKARPAEPEGEDDGAGKCRPSLAVDELMSETVRAVRLALQRHGRCARIAFNLTARTRLLPGGQGKEMTPEERVAILANTLADWYALFTAKAWADEWAKRQWETYVTPLLQNAALPQIPEDAEVTSKTRKKYWANLTEKLEPAVKSLVDNDRLCRELSALWARRWQEDDIVLRKCLRWLRDWILPRGNKAETDRAIRHVGGLSLTRIATIKSLYQVQKAFHMRPEPEDLRKNIPSRGDDALVDFGQSILNVLEHVREQRVKQLASRIVEAALGIGSESPKHWNGGKRPRQRINDLRFARCDAVVIEDLTHYRPEETRTRQENRQLMSWASGKIRKYLAEACQLHGLYLREVQAGYTSRQDSRTGAPGIRCQDVPIKEFMQAPFWRHQVAQAEKRQAEGKSNARERYLCDLNARWKDKSQADWEKAGAIRVPLRGGEIFVSANPESPAVQGLQADLNAAANIGLKALLDPDWPGKWWYVPCDPTTFKPAKDKVAGCRAISLDKSLQITPAAQDTDPTIGKHGKAGTQSRQIVNLWRDVSSKPISAEDGWREFTPYWNDVQARVVNILRQSAGLTGDQG